MAHGSPGGEPDMLREVLAGVEGRVVGADEQAVAARERLKREMQGAWREPPIDELEAVLRLPFTLERARVLLFKPVAVPEDVKLYVMMVADPPDKAPREHPQFKVQTLALAMLYLVHMHDAAFVKEFVLSNGIEALGHLVANDNLMIRAQAMESLMTITGSEQLDWFENPPSRGKLVLHQGLLRLTATDFLKRLMKNYEATFPGGSMLSLQLLGFYLSWLRLFYCKDNIIRVSRELLDTLCAWSERSDLDDEETAFAAKLYDDFKRFPAEAKAFATQFEAPSRGASIEEIPEAEQAVTIPELSWKAKGNGQFAQGLYEAAIASYTAALEEPLEDDLEEKAKILGNRAAAYLEQHKTTGADGNSDLRALGIQDCREAIAACPGYPKPYYRLARALMDAGELSTSREAVLQGIALGGSEKGAFESLLNQLNALCRESEASRLERDEIYHAILKRFHPNLDRGAPSTNEITQGELATGERARGKASETQPSDESPATTGQENFPSAGNARPHRKGKAKQQVKRKPVLLSKILRLDPTDLAEKLLEINDQGKFQDTFGDKLDEAGLCQVLDAADAFLPGRGVDAFSILDALSRVNRFKLAMMFLSSSRKQQIASMLAIMRPLLSAQEVDITNLEENFLTH